MLFLGLCSRDDYKIVFLIFSGTIDDLITTQIFVEEPNAVDVMLEIVKIK